MINMIDLIVAANPDFFSDDFSADLYKKDDD